MAERKNRDLRATVAPLLKSAAQKFPGEKLNASPNVISQDLTPFAKVSSSVSAFFIQRA
jgi:hypothetical protein